MRFGWEVLVMILRASSQVVIEAGPSTKLTLNPCCIQAPGSLGSGMANKYVAVCKDNHQPAAHRTVLPAHAYQRASSHCYACMLGNNLLSHQFLTSQLAVAGCLETFGASRRCIHYTRL